MNNIVIIPIDISLNGHKMIIPKYVYDEHFIVPENHFQDQRDFYVDYELSEKDAIEVINQVGSVLNGGTANINSATFEFITKYTTNSVDNFKEYLSATNASLIMYPNDTIKHKVAYDEYFGEYSIYLPLLISLPSQKKHDIFWNSTLFSRVDYMYYNLVKTCKLIELVRVPYHKE